MRTRRTEGVLVVYNTSIGDGLVIRLEKLPQNEHDSDKTLKILNIIKVLQYLQLATHRFTS